MAGRRPQKKIREIKGWRDLEIPRGTEPDQLTEAIRILDGSAGSADYTGRHLNLILQDFKRGNGRGFWAFLHATRTTLPGSRPDVAVKVLNRYVSHMQEGEFASTKAHGDALLDLPLEYRRYRPLFQYLHEKYPPTQ